MTEEWEGPVSGKDRTICFGGSVHFGGLCAWCCRSGLKMRPIPKQEKLRLIIRQLVWASLTIWKKKRASILFRNDPLKLCFPLR